MRTSIEYVTATREHARSLAPWLRQQDIDEIAAIGRAPLQALLDGVEKSATAVAALIDGEPHALLGVLPGDRVGLSSNDGVIWCLSTDRAMRLRRVWAKDAPEWLVLLGDGFKRLCNLIEARQVAHIGWLERAGFRFHEPEPLPPYGMLFFPFERAV